jgi:short-subunit dehydrogenase
MTEQRQWALVTGASSGLGIEFAKILASKGYNLVLVARREAPMTRLAQELRQAHDIKVAVEPLDLTEQNVAHVLKENLRARGIVPDVLVNNAAFGLTARFVDHDPAKLRQMLQLDIVATTELAHAFAKSMMERGSGHILFVASIAGFTPTPMLAAYGAAKAYVISLAESLRAELAPKIGVTVLSPGLMDTGFFEVASFVPPKAARISVLPPAEVAAIGLAALFSGKSGVVAGRLNRIMTFSSRFLSRHRQAKMGLSMMKD